MSILPTIRFVRGAVELIDQTLLPDEYKILRLETVAGLCEAIKMLRIRGAPALGIAGAYGLLLAVEESWREGDRYFFDMDHIRLDDLPAGMNPARVRAVFDENADALVATRPTAVNLRWAVDRMRAVYRADHFDTAAMLRASYEEAIRIYEEDLDMCRTLGRHGAMLLNDGDGVMTHCNTGGLATSGLGTALGVVFAAVEDGKRIHVYADETRPLLQGARLNTWECTQRGIPVSVLCDGASGSLMSRGLVQCVVVGADRIAFNGDSANKIGTLNLAIVAKRYGVPFYIAAPTSTIDLAMPNGDAIPIEQRGADEVKSFRGVTVAPEAALAENPAFDVTPADLIAGWITEAGVLHPPFDVSE